MSDNASPSSARTTGGFVLAWLPTALWMGVLFGLSAIPNLSTPSLPSRSDWVAHFGVYAILAVNMVWGRIRSGGRPSLAILFLIGVLYAFSDEWHQSFVPGRSPAASDLVFDAIGLAVGLRAAAWWWHREFREGIRGP